MLIKNSLRSDNDVLAYIAIKYAYVHVLKSVVLLNATVVDRICFAWLGIKNEEISNTIQLPINH